MTPPPPLQLHLSAEDALDLSIELERLLGELGATGKGLGIRAWEVKHLLTERAYEDLRYVAYSRNIVTHDNPRHLQAEERRKYELAVHSCRVFLERLVEGRGGGEGGLEEADVVSMSMALERQMHGLGFKGKGLRARIDAARGTLGTPVIRELLYVADVRERYLKRNTPPLRGEERQAFEAAAEEAARQLSMRR